VKKTTKKHRKYPKLSWITRQKASLYIAEEIRAGYPMKQAVAIGISRASAVSKKAREDALVARYL
jgi:hypothetical protein